MPLRLVPTGAAFEERREELRAGLARLRARLEAGTDPPLAPLELMALEALCEEYFLVAERAWLQRQLEAAA